jgi:acid phosphatase type 7
MTYFEVARTKLFARTVLSLIFGFSTICGAESATSSQPEVMIFAVGDLAQCDLVGPDESPTAKVAHLVEGNANPILMLGDLAYPDGSKQDFSHCFDPPWGKFKGRIFPVPGNHEYHAADAAPYYTYFGERAGVAKEGYYATQIGSWRVIGLNSNVDVAVGSAQESWLRDELTAHPARCTLAFWHHPRFSSGRHGDTPSMDAIWRDLYNARVDVVLAGHDHDYERFAPQGALGERDVQRGMREFVIGTGGAALRPIDFIGANSEARSSESFGVLKLTLRDKSYGWEFIAVAGNSFRDSGEALCQE